MTPVSLGRVNVATPGTAVRLAAGRLKCAKIRVNVVGGLTGKVFIGTSDINGTTMEGVIAELSPVAADALDRSFEITSNRDADVLDLSAYWIDASVAGEGLIVSYWLL